VIDTHKVTIVLILLIFVLAWQELTHSELHSVFVEFFSAISLRFQFTLAVKISGLESYQLLLGSQEACDFMNVVAVS
jgi:hypothetical protein